MNGHYSHEIPKSEAEILRENHQALQDWHDSHHGLTFMDACPYEPCRLLTIEFTRYSE